jgi:hypothetical protein
MRDMSPSVAKWCIMTTTTCIRSTENDGFIQVANDSRRLLVVALGLLRSVVIVIIWIFSRLSASLAGEERATRG